MDDLGRNFAILINVLITLCGCLACVVLVLVCLIVTGVL